QRLRARGGIDTVGCAKTVANNPLIDAAQRADLPRFLNSGKHSNTEPPRNWSALRIATSRWDSRPVLVYSFELVRMIIMQVLESDPAARRSPRGRAAFFSTPLRQLYVVLHTKVMIDRVFHFQSKCSEPKDARCIQLNYAVLLLARKI